MIRVVCGCGRVFKAEFRHAGKRTRCPACGMCLIIGQTPSSGSGEGDVEEVPSWWYPSVPPGSIGTEPSFPVAYGDPESVRTAFLEPGPVPSATNPGGHQGGGGRGPAVPAGAGRSLWTLAGAVAVMAALALGVLCWIWWTIPISGETTANPRPRPGTVPPDLSGGPSSGIIPDGRSRSPLDDRFRNGGEGRPVRSPRRLRLLVPAYIYPAGDGRLQWRRLIDAAAKVDLVAIVNPGSGPGVERNSEYAALIAEAADRGVKLVGYISTQWAERPPSEVKGDVDAWVRFYPGIVGFFLDQQPADARPSGYMAEIAGYARGKLRDALVITDPGFPCDEIYLTRHASDLVCVFSNFEGFASFELPANLRRYDSSRFAALVYQVGDAETMSSMLKAAIIKRIGFVFITDGKPPNPWGRLPAYWEAEVEALARLQ
jgi:hypothetical protein